MKVKKFLYTCMLIYHRYLFNQQSHIDIETYSSHIHELDLLIEAFQLANNQSFTQYNQEYIHIEHTYRLHTCVYGLEKGKEMIK